MRYYLATDEKDIFHYGCLEDGQEVKTGQPILIIVETIEEFRDLLKKYNLEENDKEID
jgi:hypothetical protein